jgi:hypothetical protein
MSGLRGLGKILQRMMTSLCGLRGAIIKIWLQFNSYIADVFIKRGMIHLGSKKRINKIACKITVIHNHLFK